MVKNEKIDRSEQFKLRMPSGLRSALESQAAANRRSLNSEIVVCLEKVVCTAQEQAHGQRT
jgi:predicted HicB family RNase H-like nuclease